MVQPCGHMGNRRPLTERRIIDIIIGRLERMPDMPVGFGDDVSACALKGGDLAILKTDMLVGKTDVPKSMSLRQAARKAVVMNVSDFAAKGVQPVTVLVSLGLPQGLSERDVEEIGDGLNAGAREYGAFVVGGDTGEACDLVVSVSVFGVAQRQKLMLRSGASSGDIVAVTGLFGKTSAALKILLEGFDASQEVRDVLVESVMVPRARLKEGLALAETGVVTAAIDSSDGLAWSLYEISRASGVGFLLERVPVAGEVEVFAVANKLDAFGMALYGGEEYELVLTVRPHLWSEAVEAVERVGGRLLRIGRAVAGNRVFLETRGGRRAVERRGYEHFKAKV